MLEQYGAWLAGVFLPTSSLFFFGYLLTIAGRTAARRKLAIALTFVAVSITLVTPAIPTLAVPGIPKVPNWGQLLADWVPSQTSTQATQAAYGVLLAVSGVLLLFTLAGYSRLRRECSRCEPCDLNAGPFPVYVSKEIEMPLAVGLRNRRVLVPDWFLELAPNDQRPVLEHEAAHLRSHDPAYRLLGHMLLSMFWWNPFVWLLVGMQNQSIEHAADDEVLIAGVDPVHYVTKLVAWAKSEHKSKTGSAEFAKSATLVDRVRSILDPTLPRERVPTQLVVAALVLTASLTGFIAIVVAADSQAATSIPSDVRVIRIGPTDQPSTSWSLEGRPLGQAAAPVGSDLEIELEIKGSWGSLVDSNLQALEPSWSRSRPTAGEQLQGSIRGVIAVAQTDGQQRLRVQFMPPTNSKAFMTLSVPLRGQRREWLKGPLPRTGILQMQDALIPNADVVTMDAASMSPALRDRIEFLLSERQLRVWSAEVRTLTLNNVPKRPYRLQAGPFRFW